MSDDDQLKQLLQKAKDRKQRVDITRAPTLILGQESEEQEGASSAATPTSTGRFLFYHCYMHILKMDSLVITTSAVLHLCSLC